MIINTTQTRGAKHETANGQIKLSEARAVRYTCEAWFPVNPEVLKNIRKNIRDGTYRSARDLIEAARQDFALFGHILKELGSGACPDPQKRDLVTRLQMLSLPEVKSLIPAAETKVSSHRFTQLNELQKLRLQHFVISSATVEALIEKAEVDAYAALCGVFFRQLGYALVCWNYPRIYLKAMQNPFASGRECDNSFTQILGFSPFRLGLQLAANWGAPRRLLDILERTPDAALPAQQAEPTPKSNSTPESELIARLCTLGDANARAYDPQHFSSAKQDSASVAQEVGRTLGPQGLTKLQNFVKAKWAFYSAVLQSDSAEPAKSEAQDAALEALESLKRNTHIQGCSGEVKRALRDVYSNITPGFPSPAAIKQLIEKTIPTCGFNRGCIYLIQDTSLRLMPSITIGESKEQVFTPLYMKFPENISDPVERARLTQSIVKGQLVKDGAISVLYLAAPLGSGGKSGVIYLETSYAGYVEGAVDVMLCFKALHQALCDALNLPVSIKT